MTDPHLSAETASDMVEGLLSPAEAATADEHLAECAECRDLRDALADVRALLGDLPEAPMPTDVSARLDETVAAARHDAVSGRAGRTVPGAAGAATPGAPAGQSPGAADLDAARARRAENARRLRWLGAAAASLVLVVGGAVLLGQDGNRDGQTAASAGRESAETGGQSQPRDSLGGRIAVTTSGRAYDAASLPGAVDDLLAATPRGAARGQPEISRNGAEQPDAAVPPPLIDGCLRRVAPQGTDPLAADVGTFSGRPAIVIVLPASPGELEVVVVDPSCSAVHADVRYRTRVPRP